MTDAKRTGEGRGYLCDLVLLVWNQPDETKVCVDTLFSKTEIPVRLIIVDNASDEIVREYLRSIKPSGAIKAVVLLRNEKNVGFPRAMNQGMRATSAGFVCLLTNDLQFTHGWLNELIAVARCYPRIGALNPSSNTLGVHPDSGTSLDAYAGKLAALKDQYVETSKCSGFCLLIKREVMDAIGLLSEEVDRYFFEDEDYSMSVQKAGWQCGAALGSYVYHTEHTTVRHDPQREALFTRNQTWCYKKWGGWLRVAWQRFTPIVPGSDELREWLERLLLIVRQRTYVYIYCSLPEGLDPRELFKSVGLIPHTGIYWKSLPAQAMGLAAIFSILKRQKKPFDLIISPDANWAARMNGFSWLHRARVITENETPDLDLLRGRGKK